MSVPRLTRVFEKVWKDKMPGGLADDKVPSDFDKEQLASGVKVEMEHTDDKKVATEIAMDHLSEDPEYYKKLKKMENESIDEAGGDEFVDYGKDKMHPMLAKKREDLKKTLEWVVGALEKSGTPQMKRIADILKKVPDMPSDQVAPTLIRAHSELWDAKRAFARVNPEGAKDVEDAMQALPSALKLASSLNVANVSDKGLWQNKPKGYVDDKTGEFRRLGTVTYPTGMDAPKKQPALQGQASREKFPVKPKPAAGFTVRKKKTESAYDILLDIQALLEAPGKIDWKKSFGKARKAAWDAGDLSTKDTHKVAKMQKAQKATKMRAGGPEDDPLKTTTSSETFETNLGTYFIYKGMNGKYYSTYVSADFKKARDLGEHGSRKEAVDAALGHHDKASGGLGESVWKQLSEVNFKLPDGRVVHNLKDYNSELAKLHGGEYEPKPQAKVSGLGNKPKLAAAKGKYLHVNQNAPLTPHEMNVKKLTYDDLDPSLFKNYARLDGDKKSSRGWWTMKVEDDGSLTTVTSAVDSGD